jgi:hypothetical protein
MAIRALELVPTFGLQRSSQTLSHFQPFRFLQLTSEIPHKDHRLYNVAKRDSRSSKAMVSAYACPPAVTVPMVNRGLPSIDQVLIPPSWRNDQSYARIPDGGKDWRVISTPTIGASNTLPSITPTPTRIHTVKKTGVSSQQSDACRASRGQQRGHTTQGAIFLARSCGSRRALSMLAAL